MDFDQLGLKIKLILLFLVELFVLTDAKGSSYIIYCYCPDSGDCQMILYMILNAMPMCFYMFSAEIFDLPLFPRRSVPSEHLHSNNGIMRINIG